MRFHFISVIPFFIQTSISIFFPSVTSVFKAKILKITEEERSEKQVSDSIFSLDLESDLMVSIILLQRTDTGRPKVERREPISWMQILPLNLDLTQLSQSICIMRSLRDTLATKFTGQNIQYGILNNGSVFYWNFLQQKQQVSRSKLHVEIYGTKGVTLAIMQPVLSRFSYYSFHWRRMRWRRKWCNSYWIIHKQIVDQNIGSAESYCLRRWCK